MPLFTSNSMQEDIFQLITKYTNRQLRIFFSFHNKSLINILKHIYWKTPHCLSSLTKYRCIRHTITKNCVGFQMSLSTRLPRRKKTDLVSHFGEVYCYDVRGWARWRPSLDTAASSKNAAGPASELLLLIACPATLPWSSLQKACASRDELFLSGGATCFQPRFPSSSCPSYLFWPAGLP